MDNKESTVNTETGGTGLDCENRHVLPWKAWDRGWGETAKIATGICVNASKSMTRGQGFQWSAFGVQSKPKYKTMHAAKVACESYCKGEIRKMVKFLDE